MKKSEIEAKLGELEVAFAKQSVHLTALEHVVITVGEKLNLDGATILAEIDRQQKKHWDQFLLYVEKSRPDLAARLDTRSIDEIPTDDETI